MIEHIFTLITIGVPPVIFGWIAFKAMMDQFDA